MEGILGWIIQIVIGAVGGNVGGAVVKNSNLGTTGNSVVGAIGGLILGIILNKMTGGAVPVDATTAAPDAAASGMDIGAIIKDVVGGGAGGAILTVIVGLIKNSMGGKAA
jgi:uncharacterized membrane protein YeaQ/YmgE (transglycosylase-associated protein family)